MSEPSNQLLENINQLNKGGKWMVKYMKKKGNNKSCDGSKKIPSTINTCLIIHEGLGV